MTIPENCPILEPPVAYLDTVQLLLTKPLPKHIRRAIKQCANSVKYRTTKGAHKIRYPRRLLAQQLTRSGLRVMDEIIIVRYVINRVEIAFDFPARDVAHAEQIADYLRKRLVQKWHGKRRLNVFKNTTYWATHRWTARNVTIYADRISKVTGGPCCHVEIRYRTTSACRRAGFGKLVDLLEIDARQLWAHQIALYEWKGQAALERSVCRAGTQATRSRNRDLVSSDRPLDRRKKRKTIFRTLCRALAWRGRNPTPETLHEVPAQHWREYVPWFFDRCFRRLPDGNLGRLLPAVGTLVNPRHSTFLPRRRKKLKGE